MASEVTVLFKLVIHEKYLYEETGIICIKFDKCPKLFNAARSCDCCDLINCIE